MPPVLFTKREAAQLARVCVPTFCRLIRAGRGPAVTLVGGKQLVREDALTNWLDSRTEQRPLQAAE